MVAIIAIVITTITIVTRIARKNCIITTGTTARDIITTIRSTVSYTSVIITTSYAGTKAIIIAVKTVCHNFTRFIKTLHCKNAVQ